MAKKDEETTSVSHHIFKRGKIRVAVRLADASVIEENGPGSFVLEVNGVRHVVEVPEGTKLEDLMGAASPAD